MAILVISANRDTTVNSGSATNVLNPGATITTGDYALVAVALDNIDVLEGSTSYVSCTDSKGHVYQKLREQTEANTLAATGVTTALFLAKITNPAGLTTGDSITLSWDGTSADNVAGLAQLSPGANKSIVLSTNGATGANATAATSYSVALSGLTNVAGLYVGISAAENEVAAAVTKDTAYSLLFGAALISSTAGAADANIAMSGGTLSNTSTGDTYNAASLTSSDRATILVRLEEADLITQNKSAQYNVSIPGNTTKGAEYSVVSTTTQSQNIISQYAVSISTWFDKAASYNILNGITKDTGAEYAVAIETVVGSVLRPATYAIDTVRTIDLQSQYVVSITQTLSKAATYSVSTLQQSDKQAQYTTRTAPSLDKQANYSIFILAGQSKNATYTVFTPAALEKSTAYRVISTVGLLKAAGYEIAARNNTTISADYKVLTPQAIQRTGSYTTSTAATATKSGTYQVALRGEINCESTYKVLTNNSAVVPATYTAFSIAGHSVPAEFVVAFRTSLDFIGNYNVFTNVVSNKQSAYRVLQTVGTVLHTEYRAAQQLSLVVPTTYFVSVANTSTKAGSYAVFQTRNIDRTSTYTVLTETTLEQQASYGVRNVTGLSVQDAYRILNTNARTFGSTYEISEGVEIVTLVGAQYATTVTAGKSTRASYSVSVRASLNAPPSRGGAPYYSFNGGLYAPPLSATRAGKATSDNNLGDEEEEVLVAILLMLDLL